MQDNHNTNSEGLLAALAQRQEPMTTSTIDGEVRDASTPLADRIASVRGLSKDNGEGSCPFTGWES